MTVSVAFQHATQRYFAKLALKQAAATSPPASAKSVLQTPQVLTRQSPQPDRLVATRAAASPLFEAARSLLDALPALARVKGQLDTAYSGERDRRFRLIVTGRHAS